MSLYKPGRPFKFNPFTQRGHKPPASPGEYRIRDTNGSVLYIGETCNLKRRTKEHLRNGKLSSDPSIGGSIEFKVADGRSTSRTRREHERQKINQHHPTLNKSRGGEGRPSKK